MFKNRILMDDDKIQELAPALSPETEQLKSKLQAQQTSGRVMFGHHDTLAYGRSFLPDPTPTDPTHNKAGWQKTNTASTSPTTILSYPTDDCDIYRVINKYPKMFSWDIALDDPNIVGGNNILINGIKRNELAILIQRVHASGGINTICWHCHNPKKVNNKFLKVNERQADDSFPNAVSEILDPPINPTTNLPDTTTKDIFLNWVDEVALFIKSLVDANNKPIPVIFRPLHEVTKDNPFFWWHMATNGELYRKLWNLVYDRIRNTNSVTNALFCFSINDYFLLNGWEDKGESGKGSNSIANKIIQSIPDNYDIIGYDAYQRFYLESQFVGHNVIKSNDYFTQYPERYYDPTQKNIKIDKYTKSQNKGSVDNNEYGSYNFGNGVGIHYGFLKRQTMLNAKYIMQLAHEKGKIVALTEIGADCINFQSDWFENVLGEILATTYNFGTDKINFAYTTLWRNPNPIKDQSEYYAPFMPCTEDINNGDYTNAYNTSFINLFNRKNSNTPDPTKPNIEYLLELLDR